MQTSARKEPMTAYMHVVMRNMEHECITGTIDFDRALMICRNDVNPRKSLERVQDK